MSELLLPRKDSQSIGRPLDLGVPKNLSAEVMTLEGIEEGLILSWEKVHGF